MYLKRPSGLVRDGGHLTIHIEQLAFVQAEAFDDVLKCVRMHGFLECLAQQILAALGIGEVTINGEHDVVGDERLRRGEEAEVPLDGPALVCR